MTTAEELIQRFSEIREFGASEWHAVRLAVHAYNWATCPSRYESDREYRALRRFARYCRRRLEGLPGWTESENGRLVASVAK